MSKQFKQDWKSYIQTTKTNAPLFLRLPAQHIIKVFGYRRPSEVLRALASMRLSKSTKRAVRDELTTLTDDWGQGNGGNHENISHMHTDGKDGWVSLGANRWEHLATAGLSC